MILVEIANKGHSKQIFIKPLRVSMAELADSPRPRRTRPPTLPRPRPRPSSPPRPARIAPTSNPPGNEDKRIN